MFIKKKLLFICLYLIGMISIHAQETYHKVIIHNPDGIGIPQLIKYGLDADHGMEIKSKTVIQVLLTINAKEVCIHWRYQNNLP